MQNFRNLVHNGDSEIILITQRIGTFLVDFTRFEPFLVQNRSRVL